MSPPSSRERVFFFSFSLGSSVVAVLFGRVGLSGVGRSVHSFRNYHLCLHGISQFQGSEILISVSNFPRLPDGWPGATHQTQLSFRPVMKCPVLPDNKKPLLLGSLLGPSITAGRILDTRMNRSSKSSSHSFSITGLIIWKFFNAQFGRGVVKVWDVAPYFNIITGDT
jgi:hypothetical protein